MAGLTLLESRLIATAARDRVSTPRSKAAARGGPTKIRGGALDGDERLAEPVRVRQALEQLRQAFVARHGREPGPDDLLFPDLPHPEHLEAMMVEGMRAAGLDPAFVYAFEKTGLLVTEQNQHLIPENDLAEWDAAIAEYERKHRRREGK